MPSQNLKHNLTKEALIATIKAPQTARILKTRAEILDCLGLELSAADALAASRMHVGD